MTTGAAYEVVQGVGKKGSLHDRPSEDKLFYCVIGIVTAVAVGLNFLGFNPMKALVWSGIVQGFSVPPLLLLMMLLTNSRKVVGTQRSEEHTSELQSLMRSSYAVFCLKKKNKHPNNKTKTNH